VTSALRLRSDVELLTALAAASRGRVEFKSLPTEARPELVAEFSCVTAASARYPQHRESRVAVHVALPERYPFIAPVATVRTPIYHPNVFPSGVICLGTRWIAAQGLDIFVQRLLRLVTFDPLLVSTASPANREAAIWYERTRREHPGAFPTDRFAADELVERMLRPCPKCGRSLRLPRGRSGLVRCPSCGSQFQAQT
jgi:ubiquitin-protein ligase/ribosomal protein S27AE